MQHNLEGGRERERGRDEREREREGFQVTLSSA